MDGRGRVMKLIDANLLTENISRWLKPSVPDATEKITVEDAFISTMIEIEEQPIAYDVDKVVKQLDTYMTKLVGKNSALYQTVMRIVKGGGVE